jgi:hypothetical protein
MLLSSRLKKIDLNGAFERQLWEQAKEPEGKFFKSIKEYFGIQVTFSNINLRVQHSPEKKTHTENTKSEFHRRKCPIMPLQHNSNKMIVYFELKSDHS